MGATASKMRTTSGRKPGTPSSLNCQESLLDVNWMSEQGIVHKEI